MPAQPLTAEQKKDAARLKRLFVEWQEKSAQSGRRVSQAEAAKLLGFGQSALAQYLGGRIPLNPSTATKIAALIECKVSDFSPSLAAEMSGALATFSAVQGGPAAYAQPPAPAPLVAREPAHPPYHSHEISDSEWAMLEDFRDSSKDDQSFLATEAAARAEKFRRLRRELLESIGLPGEAPPTAGMRLPPAPRLTPSPSPGHRLVKVRKSQEHKTSISTHAGEKVSKK